MKVGIRHEAGGGGGSGGVDEGMDEDGMMRREVVKLMGCGRGDC